MLNSGVVLSQTSLKEHYDFLSTQKQSPKEYLLSLYENYDLILLCERYHAEMTQYDLILDLIGSPEFYSQASTIYFEIGGTHITPMADTFFAMKNLSEDEAEIEAIKILREADSRPMWTKYTFVRLLKGMYFINSKLPNDKKLRIVFCDYPLDWSKIQVQEEYPREFPRDSIMASTIITSFDEITKTSLRKKALAILNAGHCYTNQTWIKETDIKPDWVTAGMILKKHYGNKLGNVLINSVYPSVYGEHEVLIQRGRWDAAFRMTGNKPVGFNFHNTPFGLDEFDAGDELTNLTYQDVFTGMIWYMPIEQHVLQYNNPKFVTPDFMPEMIRRWKLLERDLDEETINEWYNKEEINGYTNINEMNIIIDQLIQEYNTSQF